MQNLNAETIPTWKIPCITTSIFQKGMVLALRFCIESMWYLTSLIHLFLRVDQPTISQGLEIENIYWFNSNQHTCWVVSGWDGPRIFSRTSRPWNCSADWSDLMASSAATVVHRLMSFNTEHCIIREPSEVDSRGPSEPGRTPTMLKIVFYTLAFNEQWF